MKKNIVALMALLAILSISIFEHRAPEHHERRRPHSPTNAAPGPAEDRPRVVDDVRRDAPPTSAAPSAPPKGKGRTVHTALGLPTATVPFADPDDDYLIEYGRFTVSYNRHRAGPNWASWLDTKNDYGGADRQAHFSADPEHLPAGWPLAHHEDYGEDGEDRGHLVPSHDRTRSEADNRGTFITTNVLPQARGLNSGPWRTLEEHCAKLARHDGRWVYLAAGGAYGRSPRRIGKVGIAVPNEFWKVAVVLPPGGTAADVRPDTPVIAVVMPNSDGAAGNKWTTYQTTVEKVEERSGWRLFGEVAPATREAIEARGDR